MYIHTTSVQFGEEIKAWLEMKNRMGMKNEKKVRNKK